MSLYICQNQTENSDVPCTLKLQYRVNSLAIFSFKKISCKVTSKLIIQYLTMQHIKTNEFNHSVVWVEFKTEIFLLNTTTKNFKLTDDHL